MFKLKKILSVFLIVSFTTISGQTDKETSVNHIVNNWGCTRDYAEWVMSKIDEFALQIQSNFEYVTNSNDSYQVKINNIPSIINRSFVSNRSKIEVSSKTRKYPTTHYINNYLYRMAKIKKIYGYARVELLFKPDYLGIGKFSKTSENSYELSLTMWQIFKSWYADDQLAYYDHTRKNFRLIFFVDKDNRLTNIKVDHVFVEQTLDKL